MTRTAKNFLSFFLGLILTVITVAALSTATQAKTDTAAEYARAVRAKSGQEAVQISAVAPEDNGSNTLKGMAAFAAILSVSSLGVFLLRRGEKTGSDSDRKSSQRYTPRSDRAFRTEKFRV